MYRKLAWIILGAIAAVLIGVNVYFAVAPTSLPLPPQREAAVADVRTEPPTQPAKEQVTMPDDELAVIAKNRATLAKLAEMSPTAAELLKFYDLNATPAKLVPNGAMVVEAPKTEAWFMVVGDPTRINDPKVARAGAEFDCQSRIMRFTNNAGSNQITTGVLIAHEISHAVDCIVKREPVTLRGSPIWLMGERNAYETGSHVLDEVTDGRWSKLVDEIGDRRLAGLIKSGHPDSFYLGQSEEDITAIKKLFGVDLDDLSLGSLAMQLSVDTGMRNALIQTKALGLDEKEASASQLRFLTAFYQHYAPNVFVPR